MPSRRPPQPANQFVDEHKPWELRKKAGSEQEVIDITQTKYPQKAQELADNVDYEKKKRSRFQYNITENAKKSFLNSVSFAMYSRLMAVRRKT